MIAESFDAWIADLDPRVVVELDSHGYSLSAVLGEMVGHGVELAGLRLKPCEACGRTAAFPVAANVRVGLVDPTVVYANALERFTTVVGCVRSVTARPTTSWP